MHYPRPQNLMKLKQNSETCHIYQVFLIPSLFHNFVGFNPYFQFIYLHIYVRRRGWSFPLDVVMNPTCWVDREEARHICPRQLREQMKPRGPTSNVYFNFCCPSYRKASTGLVGEMITEQRNLRWSMFVKYSFLMTDLTHTGRVNYRRRTIIWELPVIDTENTLITASDLPN